VIDRRTFLAGTGAVLLAALLAADAQQAGTVWRIGIARVSIRTLNACGASMPSSELMIAVP